MRARRPPYLFFIFAGILLIWVWYKYATATPKPDPSLATEAEPPKPVAKIKVSQQEMEQIKVRSKKFAEVYFSYDDQQPKHYFQQASTYLHSQFVDQRAKELKEINQPNKIGVKTIFEQPTKTEILTSYIQGEQICVFVDIARDVTLQYQDGQTKKVKDAFNRLIVWEKEGDEWKVRRVEHQTYMEPD
ncbi:hypothetical protein [Thermoflavimicrobium dichotomicum]|uniref:Uncharacterized protein n=1 Tax=Thermoflavimicrobium dichotomicum TaxID=46223 RepID=A0A1I3K8J6_9BACL|nr:hypothetical protein [Thermoflavimicrobium dichotomicum]SFI68650.1 hypothetical protein SAMN05421852_101370 [Thermoflavimicrobium dichotomicum]